MPARESSQDSMPETSGLGCMVRLAWLLVGHVAILVDLFVIFETERASLSIADLVLWIVVVGCILVRYIDVSRMKGQTATGRPATRADWRRYAIMLVAVVLVLWGVAHGASWIRR